jgi:hypothetical protein
LLKEKGSVIQRCLLHFLDATHGSVGFGSPERNISLSVNSGKAMRARQPANREKSSGLTPYAHADKISLLWFRKGDLMVLSLKKTLTCGCRGTRNALQKRLKGV